MIIEYTMLGTTVPEPTNERVDQYVCSAGYAPELGLVRLYPLGLRGAPARWSVTHVAVERFPANKDNRQETWKPVGSLGQAGVLRKPLRRPLLKQFLVPGIAQANEEKISLAVVRPVEPRFYLREADVEGEPSYRLFDRGRALKSRERFAWLPRMKFLTEDGRKHDLQVRPWGTWELLRRYPDKLAAMTPADREQYVGGALRLGPDSLFLIGNYASHRNAWLIISVFNER